MLGRGLESLIPSKNQPKSDKRLSEKPPEVSFKAEKESEVFFEILKKEEKENEEKKLAKETTKTKKFEEAIFHIEIEKISRNPWQPRVDFSEESLKELAQSIREFGIIEPLIVSKIVEETENGAFVRYQLISGERRLLAAKIAGLERVPVIIKEVKAPRENLEMALIENLQRADLNPIEAARAYARLQEEAGLTQKEIALRLGKSREAVANTLRLLNLPLEMQMALAQNKINESQARALLAISSSEEQKKMFNEFLNSRSSFISQKKISISDPETLYWQEKLEEKLGAPVKLIKKGQKGRITIRFYSEKEWQMILEKLLGKEKKD